MSLWLCCRLVILHTLKGASVDVVAHVCWFDLNNDDNLVVVSDWLIGWCEEGPNIGVSSI